MSAASNFYKKALDKPEMAQLIFRVSVLDKYLQSDAKVQRTETVARVKTATWSLDFGIAPDEQTLHTSISLLSRLPGLAAVFLTGLPLPPWLSLVF